MDVHQQPPTPRFRGNAAPEALAVETGSAPSRREWRMVFVVMLAAILLWIPYYLRSRPIALSYPDAQDYAQIARNLYRGEGNVTNTMPLTGLEWRRQTNRLDTPWNNLHRFPLPSYLQAGLMRVFGPVDLVTALSSTLFYLATIPLLFLFARRLTSYRTALLATFLFAFSASQIETSITGMTEPAATFFFLATVYLVFWPRGIGSFVLAGLLTGLAYLNRSSIVLYAVPLVFLIWRMHRERAWRNLLAFGVPAFLVILPYLWRNVQLAGDPLFSLTTATMLRMRTPASPEAHDWYQFVYEKTIPFWLAHPAWIITKWIKETIDLWKNSRDIGGLGMLFPFFVLGLFKEPQGKALRLRNFLFVVFLVHVAVMGLLSSLPRYFAIFGPYMFIVAADAILWGWDAARVRVRPLPALVAAALALPLLFFWLDRLIEAPEAGGTESFRVEVKKDNQNWLRANTPKNAVLVSDIPWTVAWYADRKCLPIPPKPTEMERFADYKERPDGIYLKAPRVHFGMPEGWDQWRKVQEGRLPVRGFRLVRVFPDNAVYYERNRTP